MKKEENRIGFQRHHNIEIVRGNSSHSFPMHSHDCFCIGIVTGGQIRFKINGAEYLLAKNSVYFVPPHIEHTILAVDKKPYDYQVICVPDMFAAGEKAAEFQQYIFNTAAGKRLVNALESYNSTRDYQKLYDCATGFIQDNVNANAKNIPLHQRNAEPVAAMVNYIRKHLDEPFSLQKLCDYTHLTKFHLLRLFKEQMGTAPYQFYIQAKVRKIKQGLLAAQPAAELAYDLKFTDQSHLCNTFKKHVGVTPKQFRKSYQKE